MKNFYMSVTIQGDKNGIIFDDAPHEYEPGYYAYVVKFSQDDNLVSVLGRIGGLLCANMCQTKMEASQLAAYWNQCYKNNGTYLYDVPAF